MRFHLYLSERQRETAGEGTATRSAVHFPNDLQWQGLGQPTPPSLTTVSQGLHEEEPTSGSSVEQVDILPSRPNMHFPGILLLISSWSLTQSTKLLQCILPQRFFKLQKTKKQNKRKSPQKTLLLCEILESESVEQGRSASEAEVPPPALSTPPPRLRPSLPLSMPARLLPASSLQMQVDLEAPPRCLVSCR